MDRNPKNARFYKDRKAAPEQSKWDHTDFERLEKEDAGYQAGRYHKARNNNDNYGYRGKDRGDLASMASDKYQRVYAEKTYEQTAEGDEKWKHVFFEGDKGNRGRS